MKGNNVTFDDNFHKEITEYCRKEGYSFNGLVRSLLRKKLDE